MYESQWKHCNQMTQPSESVKSHFKWWDTHTKQGIDHNKWNDCIYRWKHRPHQWHVDKNQCTHNHESQWSDDIIQWSIKEHRSKINTNQRHDITHLWTAHENAQRSMTKKRRWNQIVTMQSQVDQNLKNKHRRSEKKAIAFERRGETKQEILLCTCRQHDQSRNNQNHWDIDDIQWNSNGNLWDNNDNQWHINVELWHNNKKHWIDN